MTTFYSTKVHRKVYIPDNKVCGYTMRNEYNKRGASSGVRAGTDNGIVPQRLSRVATKHDANEKFACAGNTNWRNSEIEFHKTRGGSAFKVERPNFRAGTMSETQQAKELRPNFRNGLGNRSITRPGFESSKIMARQATDFDKLQAIDIENQGVKVQLSSKTIEELFSVKIPDPTDIKWIAEKARIEAGFAAAGLTEEQIKRELAVNKPLGRSQRTTKGNRNIGQSSLSTSQKLEELQQEVKDGRAESRVQQAQIIGQFALVLADTNAIDALTQLQLTNLGASLARVGVPTNHKRLGLIPRIVDNDFYNNNAGLINVLLFSKVRETPNTVQYNYDLLVKNFPGNEITGLPAVKLNTLISGIHRRVNRRYLDLERGGLINRVQMLELVNGLGGFNSSEVEISPGAR